MKITKQAHGADNPQRDQAGDWRDKPAGPCFGQLDAVAAAPPVRSVAAPPSDSCAPP